MIGYKITDEKGYTRRGTFNEVLWEQDKRLVTSGKGNIDSDGFIHFYRSPLLAILHSPIHVMFSPSVRLWECEVSGNVVHNDYILSGCSDLMIVREIEKPHISYISKIAYAILCAKPFCINPFCNRVEINNWADDWLSNKDRSAETANIVYKTFANSVPVINQAVLAALYFMRPKFEKQFYSYEIREVDPELNNFECLVGYKSKLNPAEWVKVPLERGYWHPWEKAVAIAASNSPVAAKLGGISTPNLIEIAEKAITVC